MPASPSFPSDSRGRWKKRTREPPISRRHNSKHEEEDEDDDLAGAENDNVDHDNNVEYDDAPHPNPNNPQSTSTPDPNPQETEILSDGGVRISDFPSVVRHAVNRPHSSVLAIAALERANQFGESKGEVGNTLVLENISYGQLQALSAVPADSPALLDQDRADSGNAAYVVAPPPIMEGRGVVKRFGNRVHVVPMHSDWFAPATVHRLERQVVPHFFSGKSSDHSPEKYMECRNYIVVKYMEDPEKRLTVSDCAGLVAGIDDEDLIRIVRFLDHWGIINYCATIPSREPWNNGFYLKEDLNGEIHVPSAALKSIDSLVKLDKPKCRLKTDDVYSSLSCRNGDVSDLDNRIRKNLSENHCSCCSQAIPMTYYQSQKEIDLLLCLTCFHEGRYITGHSSIDFVKVDPANDYGDLDGESWTDQETLLLLEAVEIYNENWSEIAEHVGSKSKAQCILHFLRLPVEEGLLENVEVPRVPVSSNSLSGDANGRLHSAVNGDVAGNGLHDAVAENMLPFSNSENPVMALVAFLASAVGPRVAAACAHASLAALSEDDDLSASGRIFRIEGSGHSNRMNLESLHGREVASYGDIPKQKDENIEEANTLLSAEKVKTAAKAGLAAAATKAKLFADHEEREIQRLSANIINHQLKRLELKLKQFAEVETFLMKECEQVERTRQRIFTERARMLAAHLEPPGIPSSMNLPGPGPSMINNNTTNNRQHIMSNPPSQPSISGYGSNNQSVHPNMPFRQPMFGLGPRLPFSSIQSSSTSPSAFNAPGNSQPALNHPMMRPVSGTSSGLG